MLLVLFSNPLIPEVVWSFELLLWNKAGKSLILNCYSEIKFESHILIRNHMWTDSVAEISTQAHNVCWTSIFFVKFKHIAMLCYATDGSNVILSQITYYCSIRFLEWHGKLLLVWE
jgi:hypothetical protein